MPELSWVITLALMVGVLIYVQYQWPIFGSKKQKNISKDYFRGLNYLLNEQTDKAIEVFTRMLEVEKETVEIHLALGNLFRRRGEVDRSIRIHQNLIKDAGLNKEQREKALLELANDYLRAGLLDRAETLLNDLVESQTRTPEALTLLNDIYQQEKDWRKAAATARQLEKASGEKKNDIIAHYYCEMAQLSRDEGDRKKAEHNLREALRIDPSCVRAVLVLGQLLIQDRNYQQAIEILKKVKDQDPSYLGESVDMIQQCYAALDQPHKMLDYLREILPLYPSTHIVLMIAQMLREQQGRDAAKAFVLEQLQVKPTIRGLDWLLDMQLQGPVLERGEQQQAIEELKTLTRKMLEDHPKYRCLRCGFIGGKLHWHCPSCKSWNSVKPIIAKQGNE